MSVEVMQWLKGEVDRDLAEGKKMTLDFVSRLNEEVMRLQAWVHKLETPAPAPTPGSVTSTVETDAAKQEPLSISGTQPPVEKVPLDPWEPVSLTTIGTLGGGSVTVSATISEAGTFATGTLSTSPLSKEEPAQLTGTINTGAPLIDTGTVALTGTLTSAPIFNDSASSFGSVSSDAVLIRGH